MRRWLRRLVVAGAVLAGVLILSTHRTAWALVRYAAPPPQLTVPVVGVARGALRTSWGDRRSGGRRHRGIDIFARRGTPVVAAAAGEVVRIGTTDPLGGNTVWVAGGGARLYYYAHLDGFRARLAVGERVAPGATLGYVGTTGNARTTPPHLHFGIYPATRGFVAVDPTPLLKKR
jgi:murein DD-endopeptidase MepM/ murein hydrolase activator NlpD